MVVFLYFMSAFAGYPEGKGAGEQEGEEVGDGLSHFHPLDAEPARKEQDDGDEEEPLPPDGEEGGWQREPYVLEEHARGGGQCA